MTPSRSIGSRTRTAFSAGVDPDAVNERHAGAGVEGIPRKPIDNPQPPKATYATDSECAVLLESVLAQVPRHLRVVSRAAFPLLDSLSVLDGARCDDVARQLIFLAAVIHRTADERRTAEYLLRNRFDVSDGRRSPESLLRAARCAAELDVRRVRTSEIPLSGLIAGRVEEPRPARNDDESVGDMVLATLDSLAANQPIGTATANAVRNAVAVVLELSDRHARNGGRGSAIVAMRTDARLDSRLVTHLRREFVDDVVARNIARLLVGADGTPIESALFWWSGATERPAQLPATVQRGWLRCLRAAASALGDPQSYAQIA